RLALMHDVADRDEEGGAEGKQGGDIRVLVQGAHRDPSVVVGQSLGRRIGKAVRTPRANLFE
ncbi:hypothetical protein, partial [Mycolicibacter minnesotensis]|uniref:hypothetical protein n=1 Tax=Mycolicibacter minnesotensis TaxID=1118379 RepID=UPI0021F3A622